MTYNVFGGTLNPTLLLLQTPYSLLHNDTVMEFIKNCLSADSLLTYSNNNNSVSGGSFDMNVNDYVMVKHKTEYSATIEKRLNCG